MRLLNSQSLELQSFEDERKAPPYAILSHTWGDDELSFDDLTNGKLSEENTSKGAWKILKCAEQARKDQLTHFWVDTCCIQKSSSAELSEAINSMFRWYKRSAVCYAYLNDVPPRGLFSPKHPKAENEAQWLKSLSTSRWFTRGWTLQELIAPRRLAFFAMDWEAVGTKTALAADLFNITELPHDTLLYGDAFGESISRRMSWAAKRQTTRIEDMAYCMLGIFNINMPLLYGEGAQAFQRLQEEIIKITDDETIFAWKAETSTFASWRSLFAQSPAEFAHSGDLVPVTGSNSQSHIITNQGLKIQLPLTKRKDVETKWRSRTEYIALLRCSRNKDRTAAPIGICIKKLFGDEYVRVDASLLYDSMKVSYEDYSHPSNWNPVTVRQRLDYAPWHFIHKCFRIRGIWLKHTSALAVLSKVLPTEQWDADTSTFVFSEEDLRRGRRQVVRCIFIYPNKASTCEVNLHFNPREDYRRICCYYTIEQGNPSVDIESLVRVIDGEAVLAVGLSVSWS